MNKLKKTIRRLMSRLKPSKGKRTYEEELIARSLRDFLSNTFRKADPVLDIKIEGAGVHWHVDAGADKRTCRIHCFHYGDSSADLHLGLRGNLHLRTVQLSDFAAEFERGDVAGWHWANVLKQARQGQEAGEDGVLAYYLPILERVASHPEMRKFFSFTSLNRLCFSRCSHFPFAEAGMPMLAPIPGGYYAKCGEDELQGDTEEICQFLYRHLSAVSEPPFHGCINDCLIEPLNEILRDQGSLIQVRRVQRKQWSDVLAVVGCRSCKLEFFELEAMQYGVYFYGDTGEYLALGRFFKMPTLIAAMRKWLENDGSVGDLAKIADKFVLNE